MSMKIIGNTVGTTTPKPNLMQTDPMKGDYIKGKEGFLEQVIEIIEEHIDAVNIELDHTVKSINDMVPDENGNIEISEIYQSDWNQNDETAPDYVKNRTHWEEHNNVYLIPEMTVTINNNEKYVALSRSCPALVAGETYVVTLNGVTYECVARTHATYVIIGNGKIDGDGINVNNEPFMIDSYSTGAIYLNIPTAGKYTVSIKYYESVVHTIDPKYLPESVKQTYTLPVATHKELGGVKSGGDVTVNEDGTMTLTKEIGIDTVDVDQGGTVNLMRELDVLGFDASAIWHELYNGLHDTNSAEVRYVVPFNEKAFYDFGIKANGTFTFFNGFEGYPVYHPADKVIQLNFRDYDANEGYITFMYFQGELAIDLENPTDLVLHMRSRKATYKAELMEE